MELSLVCGDSFSILPTLENKSFDFILTDPVYDISKDQAAFLNQQFSRISKFGFIVFCSPENQLIADPDQYCFWIKPISTKNTSKRYSRFVEMILLKNCIVWNPENHWSQYTNVFTDIVEGITDHPWEKPTSLLERLIRNHTMPGMTILDPFAGSHKVGLACKRTGRNFYGIEIEQKYCDSGKELIQNG